MNKVEDGDYTSPAKATARRHLGLFEAVGNPVL